MTLLRGTISQGTASLAGGRITDYAPAARTGQEHGTRFIE
jgi:hypothetical protein